MRVHALVSVALAFGLSALAACTMDFDDFQGGDAPADGGGSTPLPSGDSGGGGGRDATTPADAAGACDSRRTCFTVNEECRDRCDGLEDTCSDECPTGAAGEDCRDACQEAEETCEETCRDVCRDCAGQACASSCR